jgi:inner membrane protein
MDNLCHTLVGAALAESGLKRHTALGAATLVIGANLPDIDAIAVPLGHALGWRRGVTHGVVALAVLPVLLAGVMIAWDGLVRRRGMRRALAPARPRALLGLAAIGVLTHPLLDWMNTYGVRLLMPLDGRWFYGDALFIIDPWLWLGLGLGIALARGRAREGSRAPFRPARWATGLAALYIGAMVAASELGERLVRAELPALGIAPDARVVIKPRPATPFAHDVVVAAGGGYRFGRLRWLGSPRLTIAGGALPTNAAHPAARAAAATPEAREMLTWARLPFFVIGESRGETVVRIDDARYADGERGSFAAVVVRLPAAGDGGP